MAERVNVAPKLKKLFKAHGVDVRISTVKCKNPFVQVWTKYDSGQVIPNKLRRAAVLCNYRTNDLPGSILNPEDINYGTTSKFNLSLELDTLDRFFELVK